MMIDLQVNLADRCVFALRTNQDLIRGGLEFGFIVPGWRTLMGWEKKVYLPVPAWYRFCINPVIVSMAVF